MVDTCREVLFATIGRSGSVVVEGAQCDAVVVAIVHALHIFVDDGGIGAAGSGIAECDVGTKSIAVAAKVDEREHSAREDDEPRNQQ